MVFNVEIFDTNEEIRNGLSNRNEIKKNQGALFVFNEPGFYSFYTKDMYFPIDVIWINDKKEVVL